MKRRTAAAALTLVLALSLGACGAPEQKETERTAPEEETEAVLPEKKYADLRYLDFMPDGGAFSKRVYRQGGVLEGVSLHIYVQRGYGF